MIKLEDVLLTDDEVSQMLTEFDKFYPEGTLSTIWRDFWDKKQCLKLLEWQKQWCTEHRQRTIHFVPQRRRRWECPYCDAELEKLLKEVR